MIPTEILNLTYSVIADSLDLYVLNIQWIITDSYLRIIKNDVLFWYSIYNTINPPPGCFRAFVYPKFKPRCISFFHKCKSHTWRVNSRDYAH